jgi:hypothetical protein
MEIIDRIKEIINYKGISTHKFCIEIGVANGFFDKVKDIGSNKVLKILETYPEISPEWLITGKGEMLKGETVSFPAAGKNALEMIRELSQRMPC